MFGRPYYRRYIYPSEFKEMPIPERMNFIEMMNATRYRDRRVRNEARLAKMQYKVGRAELQLRLKLHSRELRVRTIEAYFRTGIGTVLVGVLAVALFIGIIKGIPAVELAEYVSPISGLAGIAIGYFFGRAADHKDDNAAEPGEQPSEDSN